MNTERTALIRDFIAKHHVGMALFAICLLALAIRLWNYDFDHLIDTMPLTHDSYGKFAESVTVAHGDYTPYHYAQPYFLPYTTGFILKAFYHPEDPNSLLLWNIATKYMIICSVLTVLLIFYITDMTLRNKYTALLSSLLLALIPVSVIGSRYLKEDTPLMLFTCLSIFFLIKLIQKHKWQFYLTSGLIIGISIGVKYAAINIIPFYLGAHAIVVFQSATDSRLRKAFSPFFFLGLALIPIGFLAFNPCILIDWERFSDAINMQMHYAGSGHNDGTSISGWEGIWTFYIRNAIIPGMTLPLAVAAFVGLFIAPYKTNKELLFIVTWMTFFYLELESSKAKPFPFFARYAHAIFPFLCLFASYALHRFYDHTRHSKKLRAVSIGALLICILTPATITSLINISLPYDTRLIGSEWINNNLEKKSTIFMDDAYYSPRPSTNYFKLNYQRRMHNMSLHDLQEEPGEYFVLNSFRMDRYNYSWKFSSAAKKEYDYYKSITEMGIPIKEIKPFLPVQTYGFHNPILRIYKIPPADEATKERNRIRNLKKKEKRRLDKLRRQEKKARAAAKKLAQ